MSVIAMERRQAPGAPARCDVPQRAPLARALGTSESFWMSLQADYDLEKARAALANELNGIERLAA